TLWLPFETTLVGSSFFLAWEKGAENYRRWKKEVKFVNPREAWKTYAPATLPQDEFTQNISMAAIEKKFPGELESLKKKKVENIVKRSAKEKGASEKRKKIVLYGKNNMIAEALKLTDELLKSSPHDPELLNNAGNILFMQGNFEKALEKYREASKITPDDAGIWINMARAHLKMKRTSKAGEAFDKALSLDKDVKEQYLRLYTEIHK
ncbi:MAG: tetratricopeptide repeat protein, partial [Deltaproteobacteria bacterium]|nr:tetratricopeptide repeat protein [Deltaproteobacteria bacterium]